MKYKTLDWIGRTPLCVLPWLYDVIFHPPLSMPQTIVALVLLGIQFGAIAMCLHLGNPEASK